MDTVIKVVVLIKNDNKILLLKEWSNKKNGYFWNLVKGTFEKESGETLEDCALREATEETGVQIDIERLMSCYVSQSEAIKIQFNFSAKLKDGSQIKIPQKSEQSQRNEDIVEIKWLTTDEILSMNPEGFISDKVTSVVNDFINDRKYSLELTF